MSGRPEHDILVEIDQFSTKLQKQPRNLTYLCRLASLHLDDNKLSRSRPHLTTALEVYNETKSVGLKQAIDLLDTMIKFWKADKSTGSRQDLRLNRSVEREQFLLRTYEVAKQTVMKQDQEYAHMIALKMAYVRECRGDFHGALAVLSDLIAEQAVDNVDLSYIIFKAAVILMHVGQPKQAIEYLEFIMDDPPAQDSFTKAHICAFLVHVYEQGGEKYKVFLPKAYKELQQSFAQDMPAAYSKLMRVRVQGRSGGFGEGSELWEMLAVQALDRCEYTLAAEFLVEAVSKAPERARLLQLLAEVSALLKEKERARVFAEQAYEENPHSGDLRNLLLQVAPEVWTDRLRQLSSTANSRNAGAAEAAEGGEEGGDEAGAGAEDMYAPPSMQYGRAATGRAHSPAGQRAGSPPSGTRGATGNTAAPPATSAYLSAQANADEGGGGWLGRIKSKASDALKAIHSPGPMPSGGAIAASPSRASATAAAAQSPPKGGPAVSPILNVAAGAGGSPSRESKPKNKTDRSSAGVKSSAGDKDGSMSTGTGGAMGSERESSSMVDQKATDHSKGRSSFVSKLMPDKRPKSPNDRAQARVAPAGIDGDRAAGTTGDPPSDQRPTSRSSFLSRILQPAGAEKASTARALGDTELAAAAEEQPPSEDGQEPVSEKRLASRSSFLTRILHPAGEGRASSPKPAAPHLSPVPDGEATAAETQPTSPARTRGSIMSKLLPDPDRGSKSPGRGRGDTGGGFLSSLLPSSFRPSTAESATSTTTRDSRNKPSAQSVAEPKGLSAAKSPARSPHQHGQQQMKGTAKVGRQDGGSGKAAASLRGNEGALQRDERAVHRPQRPTISRDERRMLDLILDGNENVPLYDDNLRVLLQFRASAKKGQLQG